jgi:hypothetical protein
MRASTVTTTEAPYRRIDEDRLVIGLAALAVALHVIEAAIPSPLPGIRPGMANLITLLAFFRYGWRIACWITVLRVIGGSLLIGTFLTPTFILSVAGAGRGRGARAPGPARGGGPPRARRGPPGGPPTPPSRPAGARPLASNPGTGGLRRG